MKLVSYNIHYAVGRDGREDLERIAGTVRGADIIALQEVERNFDASGPPDQPAALEALMPEYNWVYAPAFDVDCSERKDDGLVVNRRRQHGVMILSKTPVLSCRPLILPKTVYDNAFNMQMGGIEGVIESSLGALRVYCVHLGYLGADERSVQIKQLLSVVQGAPGQGGAWTGPALQGERDWSAERPAPPMPQNAILLGDFNMTPDSHEYGLLTGLVGRSSAFVDAWHAAGKRPDAGHTFVYPPERRDKHDKRIDYCFVCPELAEHVRNCWVDTTAQGSDHQPVWTELAD
jgi:endonuclease/exonuclease/phosphatase family metal-dependent hydrolase